MAYTKQTWYDTQSGGTPVSADRLNYIEDGIFNAAADADTAETNAAAAVVTADAAETTADAAQATADSVATAYKPASFSAKGQLIVGTGSGTGAVISPTADGRFLEAASGDANGLKWGRKFTVSATPPASPTTGDLWLQT